MENGKTELNKTESDITLETGITEIDITQGGPSRKKSVYTRNCPPARKRAPNSNITQLIVEFTSLLNNPNRLSFQTALSYVKFHEYLT